MKFEWDAVKEAANRGKHGVSFSEAREVLRSFISITVDDVAHSLVEDRE